MNRPIISNKEEGKDAVMEALVNVNLCELSLYGGGNAKITSFRRGKLDVACVS